MKKLLKKIYKIYKKIFLFLWNQFLILSTRSKIIVIILILLSSLIDSSNEEDNFLTTVQDTTTTVQDTTTTVQDTTTTVQDTTTTVQDTTTTVQDTTDSQCIEWDKATKSHILQMADLLKIYVDQTENYINNTISFEVYLNTLDELIYESGELIDLQQNTIPNKENETASGSVRGAFAAYNQGFYSYKTGQEENDEFWINEGNDYIEFGTFNINEYYKTLKNC